MDDSRDWRVHFERNAAALLPIPWEIGADLTDADSAAIAASLQEFQAGEYSEGRHLYAFAQAYAAQTGDYEYVRAIRLFIAEEQRHALCLGRFLAINGIPLIDTTFKDWVFRRLRNLISSLELSIAVLITAELIAKVYYRVLRNATHSVVLRRLCDQILSDEDAHVRFQCGHLRKLRADRTTAARIATLGAQRFLYAGTVLLVGWSHRSVVRRGGLTLRGWWTQCWTEFDEAFEIASRAPVLRHRAEANGPAVREGR